MPSFLETLLALNGGNLPPLPNPAPSMPLLPAPQAPISAGPAYGAPPGLMASDVAPTAPMGRVDQGFINNYAGPAPTPPVVQQPSTLEKIGAILSGIGIGPEYGMALREERQRPQREYQAKLERYQGARREGIQLEERRRERQQEMETRQAQEQSRRDFEIAAHKTNITDQTAQMYLAHALQLDRDAKQQAAQAQAAQEVEQKQLRLKAADLAKAYRLAGAIDPAGKADWAKELAETDLHLRDKASPGALRWLSAHVRLEQARANKAAAPAGTPADKNIVDIVDEKGNVITTMPYSKVKFADSGATIQGYPGAKIRPQQKQAKGKPSNNDPLGVLQ